MMISGDTQNRIVVKDAYLSNGFVANNAMNILGPSTAKHGHHNDFNEIVWEGCKFVGKSSDFDCAEELKTTNDPTYQSAFTKAFYPVQPNSFYGVRLSVGVGSKALSSPDMPSSWQFPVMGFPTARAQSRYKDCEFASIGGTCSNQRTWILDSSTGTVDYSSLTVFDTGNTFTQGTDITRFVQYQDPKESNINPGLCVDMECDAWTMVAVFDLEGTATGNPGTRGAILPIREKHWNVNGPRGLGDFRIPKTAVREG